MVLSDATKGITIKQPVLLIIHYSLVTTSADAAAVHMIQSVFATWPTPAAASTPQQKDIIPPEGLSLAGWL
jgi:hypothetical protein